MQIVKPIDVESALADELAASLPDTIIVTAYPPPDSIIVTTVSVYALGGSEQTAVSDVHDVAVYVWAHTYDAALSTARDVCARIRTLWLDGGTASGVTFTTSTASVPYEDPDPLRPTLSRATVRATVGARGVGIPIN